MIKNNITKEYMAGFFDGEGCVSIMKCKKVKGLHATLPYVLSVTIGNNCKAVLDVFKEKYGGGLSETRKGYWQWSLSSRMARNFLEDLNEYMIVKKEEAKIGIKFQKTFKGKSGGRGRHVPKIKVKEREFCYQKSKQLKGGSQIQKQNGKTKNKTK